MNKEFVPHKESIELKELGFDEPCFGYYFGEYDDEYDECVFLEVHNLKSQSYIEKRENNGVLSPLYQQAFRWFREKYDLYQSIDINEDKEFEAAITTLGVYGAYSTYEEAEIICLRKLIKIVKDKK